MPEAVLLEGRGYHESGPLSAVDISSIFQSMSSYGKCEGSYLYGECEPLFVKRGRREDHDPSGPFQSTAHVRA